MNTRGRTSPRMSRRDRAGFTLIEAMLAVVVLSLLVTPSIAMLRDAAMARVEATQNTRASVLAGAVLEQVVADASSSASSLGMVVFADSSAYLNTATTGLVARLSPITSHYASIGLSWSLNISALVSSNGVATGDTTKDVYRYIKVTVTWTSARTSGVTKSMSTGVLVTDLTP